MNVNECAWEPMTEEHETINVWNARRPLMSLDRDLNLVPILFQNNAYQLTTCSDAGL